MKTARFEDIAEEFERRVEHIAWCRWEDRVEV